MKNTLTLILSFFIICTSYSQQEESSRIKKKKVKKHAFIALMKYSGKYDFSSKLERSYSNTNDSEDGTTLGFIIEDDVFKEYRYPINKEKFNYKYYRRNIYPLDSNNKLVRIYTSIYQTDKEPIIVIDCIRLVK